MSGNGELPPGVSYEALPSSVKMTMKNHGRSGPGLPVLWSRQGWLRPSLKGCQPVVCSSALTAGHEMKGTRVSLNMYEQVYGFLFTA